MGSGVGMGTGVGHAVTVFGDAISRATSWNHSSACICAAAAAKPTPVGAMEAAMVGCNGWDAGWFARASPDDASVPVAAFTEPLAAVTTAPEEAARAGPVIITPGGALAEAKRGDAAILIGEVARTLVIATFVGGRTIGGIAPAVEEAAGSDRLPPRNEGGRTAAATA